MLLPWFENALIKSRWISRWVGVGWDFGPSPISTSNFDWTLFLRITGWVNRLRSAWYDANVGFNTELPIPPDIQYAISRTWIARIKKRYELWFKIVHICRLQTLFIHIWWLTSYCLPSIMAHVSLYTFHSPSISSNVHRHTYYCVHVWRYRLIV